MVESSCPPWSSAPPLPSYVGLLGIDAKGFTRLPSVSHAAISRLIPTLVDRALVAAGAGELTRNKRFPTNSGDGLLFGFDPDYLPLVVWPFLDCLDVVLAEHNAGANAPRLRLRACVHVGPLSDSGAPEDGNGAARNDTHRLLDSVAVKEALARSSEAVTHLVAILSERVYEEWIVGGYTGLHPDRCTRVEATVAGKEFRRPAWIYVPVPSVGPLADKSGSVSDRLPDVGGACSPGGRGTQHVGNGIAFMGSVSGGLRYLAPGSRSPDARDR
ncbi:hypothetical protein [Streptomyces klenkii]